MLLFAKVRLKFRVYLSSSAPSSSQVRRCRCWASPVSKFVSLNYLFCQWGTHRIMNMMRPSICQLRVKHIWNWTHQRKKCSNLDLLLHFLLSIRLLLDEFLRRSIDSVDAVSARRRFSNAAGNYRFGMCYFFNFLIYLLVTERAEHRAMRNRKTFSNTLDISNRLWVVSKGRASSTFFILPLAIIVRPKGCRKRRRI